MKELLRIYLTFAKIGAFTFGGGYAMLPLLQKETVEKNKWASEEDLMDYYAIGQCIPGIIATNTATFIGHKRRGVPGAIAATLGMITPSYIIISIIAAFIQNFADLTIVRHAFSGIRIAVCALILSAVIKMGKSCIKTAPCFLLFLTSLLILLFFSPSPVFVIIGAALLGLAFPKYKKENLK